MKNNLFAGLSEITESPAEIKERLESIVNAAPAAYALLIDGIVAEANEYARGRIGMEPGTDGAARFFEEPGRLNTLINSAEEDKEPSAADTALKMIDGGVQRFRVSLKAATFKSRRAYALWAFPIDDAAPKSEASPFRMKSAQDNYAGAKQPSQPEYIYAPTANTLVVDDILSNLTMTAGLLLNCGITADVAMSGKEAIDFVCEKDYDIVLMDHMMPEMDGVEAMEAIRALGDKYRKLPIIALTANADTESKNYLLGAGMDDFLPKPLDTAMLMNTLKKWLPPNKLEPVVMRDTSFMSDVFSEVLQAVSRIEGIDVGLALHRISGRQDVLEQTIRQTANSINGQLSKMEEYLSHNSYKDFSIAAHGMKGALANIGAMRHQELAAELEILSKSEDIVQCVEKFTAFSGLMLDLAEKLRAVFTLGRKADLPAGDSAALAKKAAEAVSFLENYDAAEAISSIDELLEFTYNETTDKLLREIRETAASFKYKSAIEMLKGISE